MSSEQTEEIKPSCKVVLAQKIAEGLLKEVREGLKELENAPQLAGFLANTDPAARKYAEYTAKTCKEKYVFAIH
jgi:methylenetetrahydrofolate dehydrogenase (NAD+)